MIIPDHPDYVRPTRIAVADDIGEMSHEMRDKVAIRITKVGCLVTPASSDPTASLGFSVFAPSELPNVTRVDRSRRFWSRHGNINDDTIPDHLENKVI